MVVAPLGAALEFFENGGCPDFDDFEVLRAPEKSSMCGWWGLGGAWVGVWNHRSGVAWGMPRATCSAILGSLAPGGRSPWWVEPGAPTGGGWFWRKSGGGENRSKFHKRGPGRG